MANVPIACTLTAEELHCGAAELLPGLAAIASQIQPISEGVRLEFAVVPGIVPQIAAVVERERQCCQFLNFELDVASAEGPVTLVMHGPPGTGAFLAGLHPAFEQHAG
jgi:hypothetical protein